ncbi:MAG: hypothetical protein K5637_05620 [Lachnospiraceae bacterium]|nr:hypothetical protein [Lachnospiraceae bacterium]
MKHAIIVAVAAFLIFFLPFSRSNTYAVMIGAAEADALSGATTVLDKPSGDYVVLINREVRTSEDTFNTWVDFFSGREISFLFEDISCMVGRGDAGGLSMAQSFQSQLPENQMKVELEDPIMMISKAEVGKYDIIVMSAEFADSYSADSLFDNEGTQAIFVKGQN